MTEKQYMTASELEEFRRGRESGKISFFRARRCERCGDETRLDMRWCSRECAAEAAELEGSMQAIKKLVGRDVKIETRDGVRREGLVSGIDWNTTEIDGVDFEWPRALILNGDAADIVDWPGIARITT